MNKKHPIMYVAIALAFAAHAIMVTPLAYAVPKEGTVEVKAGTVTGLVTDLNEKPLSGKTIKILDSAEKVKYSAVTDKDGKYKMQGLEPGTYTMIIANTQKIVLVVKEESSNHLINVMLPSSRPYSAGAVGISTPLIIGIAGGVVLVGVTAYGISEYDSDTHGRVSQ